MLQDDKQKQFDGEETSRQRGVLADQKWGYLIAYEDDIAKSDSWNDLKTLAQPVSNTLK